jgi:tetratricopeptide (TPR) repeat protein
VAVDIPGGHAGELGRPADALAAFQQVIDRYGDDPAPALRERVAAALGNQGAMFGTLGRPAEALGAYQQVIDRYGEDPAPKMRRRVERATTSSSLIRGPQGDLTD